MKRITPGTDRGVNSGMGFGVINGSHEISKKFGRFLVPAKMKIKKLHKCEDCNALVRMNAKRCIPCSEENRLKLARKYTKSE